MWKKEKKKKKEKERKGRPSLSVQASGVVNVLNSLHSDSGCSSTDWAAAPARLRVLSRVLKPNACIEEVTLFLPRKESQLLRSLKM